MFVLEGDDVALGLVEEVAGDVERSTTLWWCREMVEEKTLEFADLSLRGRIALSVVEVLGDVRAKARGGGEKRKREYCDADGDDVSAIHIPTVYHRGKRYWLTAGDAEEIRGAF